MEVTEPKNPEHGDLACSFALAASKAAGRNPREIGEMIARELARDELVEKAEIAGPGFVNVTLKASIVGQAVADVLAQGVGDVRQGQPGFAFSQAEKPLKINVEFVSVNPNGPITVGSARGAAFGDTLCRVLTAAGHQVWREYYINDGVNSEQMRRFAESVRSVALGQPVPEGGYKGDYVQGVARALPQLLTKHQLDRFIIGYETGDFAYFGSSRQSGAYCQRMLALYQRIDKKREESSGFEELVRRLSTEELQRLCEFGMTYEQGFALDAFGVTFDTWFSEQSLHDAGEVQSCLDSLKAHGVADNEPVQYAWIAEGAKARPKDEDAEDEPAVEPEPAPQAAAEVSIPPRSNKNVNYELKAIAQEAAGTLWLRSTKFGDDLDRVLIRRDGRPTYISSDVAYHKDKFNRPADADKLITVLGPDHHGYIGRLQAVLAALLRGSEDTKASNDAALNTAREKLEVLIFQLVRFVKDGRPAPMRKRDGNIYALIDLIDELGNAIAPSAAVEEQRRVGADVARFFYLMRSHDTHMDFDVELATKQSDENPVFYAQYAHARICGVLRKAEEAGFNSQSADLSLLQDPREKALILKILDLPNEAKRCAADYGVHRLTTYAVELARTYHHFYDACRVLDPANPVLTRARLAICEASKVGLHATFDLLGISAPERMEREATA